MSQIVPYFVGRGIWFWPNGSNSKHDEQACAAIVTFLHSDRLVNIAYFTPAGEVRSRENVVAMQPGDQWPADGSAFVCFVPAQAAQMIEVPDEAPAAANEVHAGAGQGDVEVGAGSDAPQPSAPQSIAPPPLEEAPAKQAA